VRRAPLAIAVALSLLALPARAQEKDSELIAQGVQLRREHRDAEALQRFRRAYDLYAAPRTRVQIALAEQALEDWVSAEKDLIEALSHDDPWVVERAEALKDSLAEIRSHLASLQIETSTAGAELWQKGVLVGKVSAEPLRVVGGNLEIEIRAAGYQVARRSLSVPAQSIVKLVVDLVPVSEGAAPQTATHVTEAPPLPSSSLQTTFAWVTLGLAGGALVTGVVGHVEHDLNATHFNDEPECHKQGLTPAICTGYADRANTFETVAIAGYVSAGVLGGASALLFILSPAKNKPVRALDLTIAPSSAVVTWRGAF
jgi:hypothetical protein